MRVRICPDIVLVAPLAIGQNLQAGDIVEVDAGTAGTWIAHGWAVETAPAADAPIAPATAGRRKEE